MCQISTNTGKWLHGSLTFLPQEKGLTEASPFDDYSYSQTLAQRMSRSRSSGLPLRDWLAATIGIHC